MLYPENLSSYVVLGGCSKPQKGPRECLNTTNHGKLFSRNGPLYPNTEIFWGKDSFFNNVSASMGVGNSKALSPKDQWLAYLEIWMHYVNFTESDRLSRAA